MSEDADFLRWMEKTVPETMKKWREHYAVRQRHITFTREGEKVTIEMSVDDWDSFLELTGAAMGRLSRAGQIESFWKFARFVNEMNRTNPGFTPYAIPEGM